MQPSEGQGGEPKSRRGRGNKSPKAQEPKSKVKIAAYVSVESARRLGIHATMTDQDRSTIIDTLIREHLRDWVVQYRPSGAKASDEPEPQGEAQAG
jgi:predicted nucleic-acid-binding protein